jgi:lipopolysaccharide export system permease protein
MTRLAGYLIRLFSAEALALFALASALLLLAQALRMFDVISVKGQDMGTLVGQVLLTLPTLAIAFAPVCIAIGLARGLRALQQNQELHIIHSSRRVAALTGGVAGYIAISALLMVLLTNVLEPTSRRLYNDWTARVAVDLVSRLLTPHKFIEVTPGVTMVIGSRGAGGELGSFFADDRRNRDVRRTYIAKSANVAADGEGYVLRLTDGAIQYMSDDLQFSEISFSRYDLAVGNLTEAAQPGRGQDGTTSIEFIADAVATGEIEPHVRHVISARVGEGVRVIALCLLVVALAFFPSGRRGGGQVPLEIVVLGAAFAERALLANLPKVDPIFASWGSVALIAGSLLVLFVRSRTWLLRGPAATA